MTQNFSEMARPRRKVRRLVRWMVMAILVLAGIVGAASFGLVFQQRMVVRTLYDQVVSVGQVKAAELESGWDRVCVATPYCGVPGDPNGLSSDACNSFQDDGVWGLIFFKGEKMVALHHYTADVGYKKGQICFRADENPAFVRVEDGVLTMKGGE